MKTNGLIRQLPDLQEIVKKDVQDMVLSMVEQDLQTPAKAIEKLATARKLTELTTAYSKGVEQGLSETAEGRELLKGTKDEPVLGVTFQLSKRAEWDFSDDHAMKALQVELDVLNEQVKEVKAKMKEREEFLKAVKTELKERTAEGRPVLIKPRQPAKFINIISAKW